MLGQAPTAQAPPAGPGIDYTALLQQLGWVDITAATVLFVFFVIGLFKGLFWQTSRIGILVVAWLGATRFGAPLGHELQRFLAGEGSAQPGGQPGGTAGDTAVYLAYVGLFLGVVILLSLCALLVQKLVAKAGLTFFDRLGGGVLGIGTGACIVMFLVSLLLMFFRDSAAAASCRSSHCHRLSQKAVDLLGRVAPDELRAVFCLQPLRASAPPQAGVTGVRAGEPAGQQLPGLAHPGTTQGSPGGTGQAAPPGGTGSGQHAPGRPSDGAPRGRG